MAYNYADARFDDLNLESGSAEENNISAMAFKLRMAVDIICMTYNYAYVRLDDLDLVLDFENMRKSRPSCFHISFQRRS